MTTSACCHEQHGFLHSMHDESWPCLCILLKAHYHLLMLKYITIKQEKTYLQKKSIRLVCIKSLCMSSSYWVVHKENERIKKDNKIKSFCVSFSQLLCGDSRTLGAFSTIE